MGNKVTMETVVPHCPGQIVLLADAGDGIDINLRYTLLSEASPQGVIANKAQRAAAEAARKILEELLDPPARPTLLTVKEVDDLIHQMLPPSTIAYVRITEPGKICIDGDVTVGDLDMIVALVRRTCGG